MLQTHIVGFAPDYVDYQSAWQLQRRTHRHVVSGQAPDTLLLLEHESVYTAGKRTEPSERPDDGTPVIDVDRGGKITWHGPGQLVGYPIVRLSDPVDVIDYVRRIESGIIDALDRIGIAAHRVEGRSGVWMSSSRGDDKIAAIGVRVAEKVTMHGFAINCSNSLAPFEHIVPCGIRDAGVTSVTEHVGRRLTPAEFAPIVHECVETHMSERKELV